MLEVFDLRPAAIIRDLDLLRPIYAKTAAYGHFGRELPEFTWERTDRADALQGRRRRLSRAALVDPQRDLRLSAGAAGRQLAPGDRSLSAPLVDCAHDRPEEQPRAAARVVRAVAGEGRAGPPRGPQGGRGRAGRGRPGRAGAGRRAAGPPRPALRLRRPGLDGRRPRCRAPGSRCASPARTSTASSSRAPPTTDHAGPLTPLRRVVSAEPVLRPEVAALTADVAERYAGTRSDVLRLAVPAAARHHREASRRPRRRAPAVRRRRGRARPGRDHEPAAAFLRHLADGGVAARGLGAPRPAPTGRCLLAHAAAATYAGGPRRAGLRARRQGRRPGRPRRSTAVLGAGHHVALTADAGPARALPRLPGASPRRPPGRGRHPRGGLRARSHDLGLVAIWDDGDDLHAEPRAPYPHTRETLLLRAEREGSRARWSAASPAPSRPSTCCARGWAARARRARGRCCASGSRSRSPAPPTATSSATRSPAAAADARSRSTTRSATALAHGPGARADPAHRATPPSLACERCRTPARCRTCAGPLALPRPTAPPACRWCGTADAGAGPARECGHRGLRAPVRRRRPHRRGARPHLRRHARCAPRAATGCWPRSTTGPAIVVATPGAEPVAAGRLRRRRPARHLAAAGPHRPARRRRRRCAAGPTPSALVRPGGRVVAVGDPAHPALQALVRWDPAGFAARESAERRGGAPAAGLPARHHHRRARGRRRRADPARRRRRAPRCSGPVRGRRRGVPGRGPGAARRRAPRCRAALGELQRVRSARKLDAVRIQVDPPSIG